MAFKWMSISLMLISIKLSSSGKIREMVADTGEKIKEFIVKVAETAQKWIEELFENKKLPEKIEEVYESIKNRFKENLENLTKMERGHPFKQEGSFNPFRYEILHASSPHGHKHLIEPLNDRIKSNMDERQNSKLRNYERDDFSKRRQNSNIQTMKINYENILT